MMFAIGEGSFNEDTATELFGPRFRIILHPLSNYGLVGSSGFSLRRVSYYLTVEGLDDLEILREKFEGETESQ